MTELEQLRARCAELESRLEEIGKQEPVHYDAEDAARSLLDEILSFGADRFIIERALKSAFSKGITHAPDSATRIAELEAEVAELKQRQQWRPIETAPKDKFLLLLGPSGYTTISLVCATGRMCSDYRKGWWIDHANDHLSDWGFTPTHWMPLPDAPAIDAAKGGE